MHTASLSSLANIFSRLSLIEHLIYLKHFVLFNCLKLVFIVIVDFLCWPVVILLKKRRENSNHAQVHIQLILYGITTGYRYICDPLIMGKKKKLIVVCI